MSIRDDFELENCPFDGSKAHMEFDSGDERTNKRWRSACTECECHSPWFGGSNSWSPVSKSTRKEDADAKAKAAAWWQRRPKVMVIDFRDTEAEDIKRAVNTLTRKPSKKVQALYDKMADQAQLQDPRKL